MKYYNLHEITDDKHRRQDTTLYTDESGEKTFTINHGDMISAPAPDGSGVLINTEIEGVVEAESEEEAALKLGVYPILQEEE